MDGTGFLSAIVWLSGVLFYFAQTPAMAQQEQKAEMQMAGQGDGMRQLHEKFPGARVEVSTATGLPRVMSGLEVLGEAGEAATSPEDAVGKLLQDETIKLLFRSVPSAPGFAASVENVRSHVDEADSRRTIVTVRQRVGDLPVFGSESKFVVVEGKNGPVVQSALMALISVMPGTDTQHTVSAERAEQVATVEYERMMKDEKFRSSERSLWRSASKKKKATLAMFDPASVGREDGRRLRPVWITRVGTMVMMIDARTSELVYAYRDVNHLSQFQINEDRGGNADVPVLSELVTIRETPTPEARETLANARKVREFFREIGRSFLGNSACEPWEGEPAKIQINILQSRDQSSWWNNMAFFAPEYGSAPDAVSHEISHGITNFTACIQKSGESGAVAEALSDFFAVIVREREKLEPWRIVDSVSEYRPPAWPLRSFSEPHLGGFDKVKTFGASNRGQPERIDELVLKTDRICASTLDWINDCPHSNSGIVNKSIFLTSEGGTFQGTEMCGIGTKKTLRIVNLALSEMTSSVNFASMAALLVNNCVNLARRREEGFKDSDCDCVRNAFTATGILK